MGYNLEALAERWKANLDLLVREENFGYFLENRSTDRFYYWKKVHLDNLSGYNLTMYNGATRIVFTDAQHDSVIKIQFTDFDEIDYCGGEAAVYDQAKECGLEQYFARCEKLFDYKVELEDGDFCSCPVYIMEFCAVDGNLNESNSYEYQYDLYCEENKMDKADPKSREEFSEEEAAYDCGYDEYMRIYAEHIWEQNLDALWDFLEDMYVCDLHSSNWGFIDNRFVICDYAGFECQVGGL